MQTITITLGDQAENHKGMQILGQMAPEGFSIECLEQAKTKFESRGAVCELIRLDDTLVNVGVEHMKETAAAVLVVRNGLKLLLADIGKTSQDAMLEQTNLDWDTKARMYGKVVNKKARHNLCYSDVAQDANYESGKGRVVPFEAVPCLNHIRNTLPLYLGSQARDLVAEGNRYYDSESCGIGYHGDAERMKLIAFRLGNTMPLHYQWYKQHVSVGANIRLELNDGDLYVMSQKATGNDWKKSSILTLRHAAGCSKYTSVPPVKRNKKAKLN